MNDFDVSIETDTTSLNINESVLSIEISDSEYILELQSSYVTNLENIEIQQYNDYDLIITNAVYATLPDEIPMSIITGNLHVSRIDGLDDYLTRIPIDGGTP